MVLYCDGFVLDKNPSPRGGGFTVVTEHNKLVRCTYVMRPGFTNNDGELLALGYAAYIAEVGDTIITDSKVAQAWVASGHPKKRADLAKASSNICGWIREKNLTVAWCPREQNLAGLYNEMMDRPSGN